MALTCEGLTSWWGDETHAQQLSNMSPTVKVKEGASSSGRQRRTRLSREIPKGFMEEVAFWPGDFYESDFDV